MTETTATTASTGVRTMTPYLCARGATDAITFYGDVFGAQVQGEPWLDPTDGRIGHAELLLGDTRFYISDEYEALDVLSPQGRGGTTVSFVVVVEDVDTVWAKALQRGATLERDITVGNGLRSGWLRDPWGHRWNVGEIHEG
ncbi:MAG: hypothetical protein AVDCRST_MAG50-2555 [uncultured Acidimicrobiales bacterium]|uniref:VOC domain-containing protein n=1 Tax=uncultured Acidimicrobiales bacterium TaxID=310071 RepID=A0A6J4IEP9_9ACTN|nr:MAG: hypothetical protein AVDCRST_MAG50-2555 [uncultured Acidimicrobiales bacterium]